MLTVVTVGAFAGNGKANLSVHVVYLSPFLPSLICRDLRGYLHYIYVGMILDIFQSKYEDN